MNAELDILNERYSPEDELIIVQYGGGEEWLPDRVKEVLSEDELGECDAGDWITIVDGEAVYYGSNTHPFRVEIYDEEEN